MNKHFVLGFLDYHMCFCWSIRIRNPLLLLYQKCCYVVPPRDYQKIVKNLESDASNRT
jgi:hypothetical protein